MLFSKSENFEEKIMNLLLKSPLQVRMLHEHLSKEGSQPSVRAIYKAVHQLIRAGVVIKAGKVVRVDEEWLRRARSRLASSTVLRLSPGERMSFSFTSIAHLDAFWKTIVLQLEVYEKDGQVFFYNPHNFWAYLPERKESEDAYYAHFATSKIHAFFTVGGNTRADKEFKKQYQNDYLQINATPIASLGREHHITILGNHIVKVRIGKKTVQQIDDLYKSGESINKLIPSLLKILNNPVSARFTLEHSPPKAAKLRKTLSRDFYFDPKL